MERILIPVLVLTLAILACGQAPPPMAVDRYSLLPDVKYGPDSDFWPPTVIEGWSQPEPLPYPVNTPGERMVPSSCPMVKP